MLFLHIVRIKDTLYALPPEDRGRLLAGHMAFFEKYLTQGKLKAHYNSTDFKRGFGVWDLASAEEAARLYREYPLTPFIESELVPVLEPGEVAKIMKESLAATPKSAAP
jgi:hypothetical protein